MQLDELAHDGETKPGTRAARAAIAVESGAKAAEDVVAVLRWDARARVSHLQRRMVLARDKRAHDRPARRRMPDGVGEQVRHDAAHALHVEAGGERSRRLDCELDVAVDGER